MRFKSAMLINYPLPLPDGFTPSVHFDQFDKAIYKTARKRVGAIRVRQGHNGDDFCSNMWSIVLEATTFRIPRILNPLYKKRQ